MEFAKSHAARIVEATGCDRGDFRLRPLIPVLLFLLAAANAFAQGGPPYYTNDPGTAARLIGKSTLGICPSSTAISLSLTLLTSTSISESANGSSLLTKMPGCASRILPSQPRYGLGQSNPGVKWRFYDAGESGLSISFFPNSSSTIPTMRWAGG